MRNDSVKEVQRAINDFSRMLIKANEITVNERRAMLEQTGFLIDIEMIPKPELQDYRDKKNASILYKQAQLNYQKSMKRAEIINSVVANIFELAEAKKHSIMSVLEPIMFFLIMNSEAILNGRPHDALWHALVLAMVRGIGTAGLRRMDINPRAMMDETSLGDEMNVILPEEEEATA